MSFAALGSVACTSSSDEPRTTPATASSSLQSPSSATSAPASEPTNGPRTDDPTSDPADPVRFDARAALRSIRFLAGEIGPREATSAAYRRAARWVEGQFAASGYEVRRQQLRVPAGNSWGVDVPAGQTWNVVAVPDGFDPEQPHVVVGAHLDTVPQAPGAEDNASGVSVIVELARLAAADETKLPVVFVAFAAEEPRGEGDALHHFGSTAMVDRLSAPERQAVRAMVSLDRIGVGTVVPVCTGGLGSAGVRGALLRTAERLDLPASPCLNTSSDHWSFEKAGMRAARVGGTSYAGYHSAGDVPAVVDRAQVQRVGELLWGWLHG